MAMNMADLDQPDPDDSLNSPQAPQDIDEEFESEDELEEEDTVTDEGEGEEGAKEPERQKLILDVNIENRSTCERHITVTIPREEIDRFFDKEFTEIMPTAQVPGFRPGHAPRKLVEKRFRKDLGDKVKSTLLMESLTQIHDDQKIAAISEPEIDLDAVELPKEGPLTFEFDLEVRPEFALPKWKGLLLEKPVRQFTGEDVDKSLADMLANRGRLVPYDGPAQLGDYITANLTFKHGEQVVHTVSEQVIRIRPVLSFRDGKIEDFGRLIEGVRAGETRQGDFQLSADASNEALRNENITAVFEVLEVKKLEMPELTPALLEELGGFTLEADLRDAVKDALERRMEYSQRRRARDQITAALTVAADWELPPKLLRRQSKRELQRAVMELQRSGFSESEIRAHENMLRQNSDRSTAQALKEHFILERIAEEENIEAEEADYVEEIKYIARQSNESPRRVRAKLEKSGDMDVLRNQVIERKVIDLILEHAQFHEVPHEMEDVKTEALDLAAGGGEHADIPEAKPGGGEPAQEGHPEHPHQHG
jgi:trigger factor